MKITGRLILLIVIFLVVLVPTIFYKLFTFGKEGYLCTAFDQCKDVDCTKYNQDKKNNYMCPESSRIVEANYVAQCVETKCRCQNLNSCDMWGN